MHDPPRNEGIQSKQPPTQPLEGTAREARRLEVTYDMRLVDLLAFFDYHLGQKAARGRVGVGWWVLLAGIFGVCLLNLVSRWEKAGWKEFLLPGIPIAAVVVYAVSRLLLRARLRKVLRESRSLALPNRVVLSPDAVEAFVGPSSGRTLWEGVVKVVRTGGRLFIYLSPGEALVVPGRAFERERDFDDFYETAQHYYQAAGGRE